MEKEHKCNYACHHISHCSGFKIEDLKKLDLYELGHKRPYFKWIDFPLDLLKIDEDCTESIYLNEGKRWIDYPAPEMPIENIMLGLDIHKCNCPTRTLFEEGCKCGGI